MNIEKMMCGKCAQVNALPLVVRVQMALDRVQDRKYVCGCGVVHMYTLERSKLGFLTS